MNNNKIAALYCRLSREDERVDSSSSIETQKKFLKRYAGDRICLIQSFILMMDTIEPILSDKDFYKKMILRMAM